MFIKRTKKRVGPKTYVNHLLVDSVATPRGPRHHVVCSLGSLAPAPAAEWLALAHKIEGALTGQQPLVRDAQVETLVAKAEAAPRRGRPAAADLVAVHPDQVTTEEVREAGPVHVGHQVWQQLGLDPVLEAAGLSPRTRVLTELMTLNRLIYPCSEHAMPDWVRRTALPDLLGEAFATLVDESLYQNLNRLHPQRAAIEGALAERERTLFNLDASLYLYDLTSTYFEGQCLGNPQAKRGYSRDGRPDCKQVVMGLVLDRDGFPKAHEVFEGNRPDRTTVKEMLDALEERVGRTPGATVVVDRGMAFADTLQEIQARGYHYLVASRPGERTPHLDAFEDTAGWQEIVREPSPRNPVQQKTRVWVKRQVVGDELHLLCKSDGREAKDWAIRAKHEERLLADLRKLQRRVARGQLKAAAKIHEAIGRLRERYPRVARYYAIEYDAARAAVTWTEDPEKKAVAQRLDGGYLLKTDRPDLRDADLWRTYILLTRVEAAFRAMKSPLCERPIFHRLEHRVQTHIFLCVLAYHLLVAIEKRFLEAGIHTSWATLREELRTHQVVTVVLPASNGDTLKIRRASTPEPRHKEIYATLRIPSEVMKPVRTWVRAIVTE